MYAVSNPSYFDDLKWSNFFKNPYFKTWSDVYQHYEDFWKFRLANPGANYRHHLKRIGHQKRLRNLNAQSRQQEDYSQWAIDFV